MMNSQETPNQSQQNTINDNPLTVQIPSPLESPITTGSPRSERRSLERSPFIVPMQYERYARSFSSKNNEGTFLGRTPHVDKTNRRQYSQICRVAKTEFLKGEEALEPTPQALERTKQAAKDFFLLSYQLLETHNMQFPLAGRNKCLGMVAVPTKNLVMIAISQDKNPTNDELLRNEMVNFLNQINATTTDWTFELACIPTKAQYLMPRTISMRNPQAAPESSVKPHTRCVEVALMAALCKAGRTRSFTSADTGIIAFGGTLWASSEGAEAIPYFNGVTRNRKYITQDPLEVVISESLSGWVDIWEPCPEHCRIYKYEMLAIGAAGGFSSSFFEPRSEGRLIQPKKIMIANQGLLLAIGFGSISAAICGAGVYLRAKNHNVLKDSVSMAMLTASAVASTITIMASFKLLFSTNNIVVNKNKTVKIDAEETDTAKIEPRSRAESCSF